MRDKLRNDYEKKKNNEMHMQFTPSIMKSENKVIHKECKHCMNELKISNIVVIEINTRCKHDITITENKIK